MQQLIEACERMDADDHSRITATVGLRRKFFVCATELAMNCGAGFMPAMDFRQKRRAGSPPHRFSILNSVDERIDSPRTEPDIRRVNITAARDKFRKFLTQKGLRVTNQRLAIFDAALAQSEHFTAEQLLDFARAIDDSVSRATVYRTLPIMVESALLREVDIGTGEKFYHPAAEGADTQVAQVVCLDCDKIFEISAPFMGWYGNTVSSKLGLTPVSQRLQVSARCDAFRLTGSCPRRN